MDNFFVGYVEEYKEKDTEINQLKETLTKTAAELKVTKRMFIFRSKNLILLKEPLSKSWSIVSLTLKALLKIQCLLDSSPWLK